MAIFTVVTLVCACEEGSGSGLIKTLAPEKTGMMSSYEAELTRTDLTSLPNHALNNRPTQPIRHPARRSDPALTAKRRYNLKSSGFRKVKRSMLLNRETNVVSLVFTIGYTLCKIGINNKLKNTK